MKKWEYFYIYENLDETNNWVIGFYNQKGEYEKYPADQKKHCLIILEKKAGN